MTNSHLSFLPEDYVERRKEHRTNLICLTLFGVVLIGVVGAYVVTTRQRGEVRDQRAAVNRAYTEAAKRLEQLEKLQQQRTAMLRKAEITRTLVEAVPRTFLLADLINRMPATLSLLECRMSSRTVAPPPTADAKKTALANAQAAGAKAAPKPMAHTIVSLSLVGVAPTDVQVAQYMSSLSRSQLVSEVSLVFSEEARISDSTMRKFRIDMTLSEKADVRTIEPLLVDRKLKTNPMQADEAVDLPTRTTANPIVGRTQSQAAAPPGTAIPAASGSSMGGLLQRVRDAVSNQGGK